MLWKFNSVYDPALQLADHRQPVGYEMSLPPVSGSVVDSRSIYIHNPRGRNGRSLDEETESFVEQTRLSGGKSA
jgi:hypothetical protein